VFVRRSLYDLQCREVVAAYDRLDMVLAENEQLLAAAERANARYESLVQRMIEMKKEGFVKPKPQEVIESTPKEEMPSVILAAIQHTFPGDQQLYALNYTYAMTQQPRWEKESEAIAKEITEGRQK
jgi:hypothetical protein